MRKIDVSCVYQVLNLVNGRRYIGSTKTLYHRKDQHLYDLRKNQHFSKLMQNDYNTFGEESLLFQALDIVHNPNDLFITEQIWLDKLQPEYNLVLKAQGFDYIREDVKVKISKSVADLWKNPNYRRDRKKKYTWKAGHPPNLGKPVSDETRKKISKSLSGVNHPYFGKRRDPSFATKVSKTYHGVVSPDGIIYSPVTNMSAFCREHDLDSGSMTHLMKGETKSHKGWTKLLEEGL